MAIAHVTFTCYYNYEVEIDDALYDEDILAAEEQASNQQWDYISITSENNYP